MTSQATEAQPRAGWLSSIGVVREERWTAPDVRRRLQLALAGIWLLDAVLQFQSFMFTKGFAQMLGATAAGNPAIIAGPINWSARLIGQHPTVTNATFAAIQLLIALGIAWRPARRLALGASIAWALGVWWLGEGLGGILTGGASPANGAPGAVIIYALLAVLLWPPRQERPAPFIAGRFTGAATARLLWLVLWGSLAYLALQPAARAPQGLSSMISGMASGQPGWLAGLDNHLGALLSHRGLAASVVLAVVLALVAVGVSLPTPAARAAVVLAVVTAAALWIAEGLGGILTGAGTDPSSGLLLALLALAYWPLADHSSAAAQPASPEGA
ncbi:MAG TPA: hypothetical protein VMK13_01430 [Streptosporangiaceae bacterium]|nr:hypothetical protein [Streptosporangiaceae bacterium]